MCYVLDKNPEVDNIINILEEDGFTPLYANLDTTHTTENPRPLQLTIEEWLRGFYDADFVVTDSFHACVFSILFRKPFVVYGNIDRGMTRVKSLLHILGLQNRLVASLSEFKQRRISLFEPIYGKNLDLILKEWKDMSYHFLKENLE